MASNNGKHLRAGTGTAPESHTSRNLTMFGCTSGSVVYELPLHVFVDLPLSRQQAFSTCHKLCCFGHCSK